MQTAIAEPAALVGQLAQLLTQTGIIVPDGTVIRAHCASPNSYRLTAIFRSVPQNGTL
jgi:hypothetical protein